MFIEVNGIKVYVEIYGTALTTDGKVATDKPVLIAVPGGPGFSHTFLKPGLNPVAEHFPLVYFDPRGTGRSDQATNDTWNAQQLADDLAALIKQLNIKNAYLYAHSGGVHVSALLMKKNPSLVKGLVSANGILSDKQTVFDNWEKIGGDIAKRAMVDLDETAIPEFMIQVIPKYDPIPRSEEHAATLEANIEQCLYMIHSFLDISLLETLHDTAIPCHFVIGSYDPLCPPSQAIPLLEKAANSNFIWEVFEQSGHDNLLCEPEKTIDVILRMMRNNMRECSQEEQKNASFAN